MDVPSATQVPKHSHLVDVVVRAQHRLTFNEVIRQWDQAGRQSGELRISIMPTQEPEIAGKLRFYGVPEAALPLLTTRGIPFEVGNHGGRQRFVGQPLSR